MVTPAQRVDPETGTYRYRARNYDPYLGQFLSMDPMGIWADPANLGNPYAYVGNNPFNSRDPFGRWCWNVFSKACREENVPDATQVATDMGGIFVEAVDSTVDAAVEVASVAWNEVESVTGVAMNRVSNAVRESVRTASATASSATNAAQTHVAAAASVEGAETQGFPNPGDPSITISAWFLYGRGPTFSGEGVSAHVFGSPSAGMTIMASSGQRDKGRYHAVGGGIGGAVECSWKGSADRQDRSDSASRGLGAGISIGVPYSYQYQSRTVEWFWRD